MRTSGEKRLSNFLLRQISYAEIFFLESKWPDLTVAALKEHVLDRYEEVTSIRRRDVRLTIGAAVTSMTGSKCRNCTGNVVRL